ncbi:MAG: 5-formyltetrahydrofolate cyclo-ligase [Candidatus Binatia bacterium]
MRDEKQSLRTRALRRREAISASELLTWSRLIKERVVHLPAYLRSRSVVLYSPIGKEVATEEIRDCALNDGKGVFYPRLGDGEELHLVRVDSFRDLRPGRYGILEPVGNRLMTGEEQGDLVVFVPGLAFDLRGNRLGRGKGCYDRALKQLGVGVKCLALAYEFQIVQELPVEEWDERVHQIITEKRVITCRDVVTQSGCVL